MKAFAVFCLLAAVTAPVLVVAQAPEPSASASGVTDADILNFALQLEYLEAEFYSCAASGQPLPDDLRGGGPPSKGCEKAQLGSAVQTYASEIADNEIAHVRLLRAALGSMATPIPELDIGPAFATAAVAANNAETLTPPFSPYLNDDFFLLGAFIFEDVGVTAYSGAAALIQNPQFLSTASQILAVEAYHGGIIRTLLAQDRDGATPYNLTVGMVSDAISALRGKLGEPGKEFPLTSETDDTPTLVPADSQGLVAQRSPDEVVAIVTAGSGAGLFFPGGLNGAIGNTPSASPTRRMD